MRTAIIALGIIAVLVGFVMMRPDRHVAERVVTLTEAGYEPRELRIRKGETVTFITDADRPFWPASNLHPDHTIFPEFDPKRPLQPGESWEFRFEKSGAWGYHDHVRSYYIGTIIVEE